MILTKIEQSRQANLEKIRELGIDPYGSALDDVEPIYKVVGSFIANEPSGNTVYLNQDRIVQGRVVLLRDNGKLIWLKIRDDSGEIQVAVSKKDVTNERAFLLAELLDFGDIISAIGPVRRTKTGEITVWAKHINMACKSLAPAPDKHAGLQNIETRYRKRYLDMAYNEDFIKTLRVRSRIISLLRENFADRGFIEVETPMLQPMAGGAAAMPFETHLNALDVPLFLRVAPELYLKRLIVGGMSKVFEINRNFRNEGIDATHNPEFTSLEAYAINQDMYGLMDVVECIILDIVLALRMSIKTEPKDVSYIFKLNGHDVNFAGRFERTSYAKLYREATGKDIWAETDFEAANREFEEKAEPLIDPKVPTFVTGYPAAISPLTKVFHANKLTAQRADLFIGGMEIGTIYTEQNDPEIQRKVFSEQISGDAEEKTHRTLDEDFIEALRVGMPPTGGLGLGVDRLVMLLSGQSSIRDVIAFPFMRPQEQQ